MKNLLSFIRLSKVVVLLCTLTSAVKAGAVEVTSLTLLDASTNKELRSLNEGATIDLSAIGTSQLSVRANTNPQTIGSVKFSLAGPSNLSRIENYAPYTLFGDSNGDYSAGTWSPPGVGSYTLTCTPFTKSKGTGTAGHSLTIHFSVVKGSTNVAPTANAGPDRSVTLPTNSITVTGSASDQDGSIVSTVWTQQSGPSTGAITNSNTLSPTMSNLIAGTYVYTLAVKDNAGATATDSVAIKVINVTTTSNIPPTASAGRDQTITLPKNSVTLNGSGKDSDGSIASYSWTQIAGPSTATLLNANTATMSAINLMEGTYTFKLTVKDNVGAATTDKVCVNVYMAPNIKLPVIDETKVSKVFYVNPTASGASDSNSGSSSSPFKSITAGINAAQKVRSFTTGVKVVIYPGTYRENVRISADPPGSFGPFVVEGTEKGKIIVKGSDQWTGWKLDSGAVYAHSWPYKWGAVSDPYPGWNLNLGEIVRRRESIFVNGTRLKQVLSRVAMLQGTYYVSETDAQVYIWLKDSSDPANSKVEVSIREHVFQVDSKQNLVLRNIRFEHDNSFSPNAGGTIASCTNVLLEDCSFNSGNWGGYVLAHCKNVTLHRVEANDNGGLGVDHHKCSYLVSQDCEASFNNVRGDWGGFHGVAVSGQKNMYIRHAFYGGMKGIGNLTRAFWFDTDNRDIMVDHAYFCDNLTNGLFIEANGGPITIQNGTIGLNGRAGLQVTNSENATVRNMNFYGNADQQISLTGYQWRTITLYPEGTDVNLTIKNWNISGNRVEASNIDQDLIFAREWSLGGFIADKNTWFNPDKTSAFEVGSKFMGLSGWKTITGQEASSTFSDPGFTDPENLNFEIR